MLIKNERPVRTFRHVAIRNARKTTYAIESHITYQEYYRENEIIVL